MLIHTVGQNGWISHTSLWDALQMPEKRHLVVSLVGGGGKTSVMYRLAKELAGRGKRVIVTTSTHIFCPADLQVVPASNAETVKNWILKQEKSAAAEAASLHTEPEEKKGFLLVTGQPAPQGKLSGLPFSEIGKLAACADVLLIEADGARRLPVKVPKEGEPVLIPETDVVIGCAGLDCIGKPMEEVCLRVGPAKRLLGKSGDSRMTPEDVAVILTSEEGTVKDIGSREYRIVLNKADDDRSIQNAGEITKQIAGLLEKSGRPGVLVAVTKFDVGLADGKPLCAD